MKAGGEDQAFIEVRESLSLAMKSHALGEIERAEQYYLEVLQHRYRVPDILLLLARIATLRGDAKAAIAYWNDRLRIEPDHLVALLGKGALLPKQGEPNEPIRVTAGIPLKIIAGHDRNSLILMPASLTGH